MYQRYTYICIYIKTAECFKSLNSIIIMTQLTKPYMYTSIYIYMQPCFPFSVTSEDLNIFFVCPSSNPPKQTQILIWQMCIYNQNIIYISIYMYKCIRIYIYVCISIKENCYIYTKREPNPIYVYMCSHIQTCV